MFNRSTIITQFDQVAREQGKKTGTAPLNCTPFRPDARVSRRA
jgi:hypothetical protein